MVGRLPTECQSRPSPRVEGHPQPSHRAKPRTHPSRAAAAAAVVANKEKQLDIPGQLARPRMAATEEALWRHRAALIKRLRAEPTLEGYHNSLPHLSSRDWGTFAGLMWDWLPAVTNNIERLAGLQRGATKPATGNNVSDMGISMVGGSGGDAKEDSNETQAVQQAVAEEEVVVHIARARAQPGQAAATAEWPELLATCVPPPTAPSRGELGRRAQGRARARARRAVASLVAASTAAAAVAAVPAIAVSVSETTRAAASAADASLDTEGEGRQILVTKKMIIKRAKEVSATIRALTPTQLEEWWASFRRRRRISARRVSSYRRASEDHVLPLTRRYFRCLP